MKMTKTEQLLNEYAQELGMFYIDSVREILRGEEEIKKEYFAKASDLVRKAVYSALNNKKDLEEKSHEEGND